MVSDIPYNEIDFVQASFCSRGGRLFEWEGDLYRGLTSDLSSFYMSLFNEGTIDLLVESGYLVETCLTDMTLGDYELIVKHRKISHVSYPYEWSSEMLKVAAQFFIDFNLELLKHELMSFDVHPYNIVYEATKPFFVDLDSIRNWESVGFRDWKENFQRFYIRPLELFAFGNDRIARLCMSDWRGWERGVIQDDLTRLTDQDLGKRWLRIEAHHLSKSLPKRLKGSLRRLKSIFSPSEGKKAVKPLNSMNEISNYLGELRDQIDSIELNHVQEWNYYEDLFTYPSFTDSKGWSAKHHGVAYALELAQPSSVNDLGSNRGWYAQFAAFKGSNVIAFDRDDSLMSLMYRDAEESSLPVLPLVMDLVWPSPQFGLLGVWDSAVDRLVCDMTMALALVHHLVHAEGMRFDQIVAGISQFSKRWLLIEFIPYSDPNLEKWQGVFRQDWYNLDNFLAALKQEYAIIKTMESDPVDRTLVLCEKLNTS